MKKNILITGGNRGIGKAIAEKCLKKGYAVVIAGKNKVELREAETQLNSYGDISTVQFDLAKPDEINGFTSAWRLPLYGIVNNAGICKTERLDNAYTVWEEVMAINITAPYQLTKQLLPYLEDKGRIINIASQLGKEGRAGYGAYCASKFGIIGLTKCWAKELGSRGITVNAVCPGWVQTEMAEQDLKRLAVEKGLSKQQYYEQICEPLELKRFTTPEEVANLVAFLLSEEGSGVTGRDWLLNTIWNQE